MSRGINILATIVISLAAAASIIVFHGQITNVAGMAKEKVLGAFTSVTPTLIPIETPIPLPTAMPTDTPTPQVQTYQQQPVQQQQAPTTVYCDVTRYVPEGKRMSAYLSPQQCAYEQAYALNLYNKVVGGSNQQPQYQAPQGNYTYPSYNSNVPPPPALGGQPVLQQPAAPNGSVNYQPPSAPTSSCHWVCTSNSNCMQICN